MRKTIAAILTVLSLAFDPLRGQEADSLRTNSQDSASVKDIQPPNQELVLPRGAGDTTSLSFKDTDLRDIFRVLSIQHGLNIFVDNQVNKRITIALNQVRVYEAIMFLCEQNGLDLALEGGIFKIRVKPPPVVEIPPPKIPFVYYENNLLSVDLKGDDLEMVVYEIERKSGKNILITSGTSGTVSGMLNDVVFDVGFTQIMNNSGYAVQLRDGIYLVSRLDYFVGQKAGDQAKPAGPYWISVKDSLVTIDVTRAPLERVISDIVRQLNTNVVFYSQVSGSVTARANNFSLSRALDLVLRNTSFSYREHEGIYYVGEKSSQALLDTKLFRLKYLRSDKLLDMIPQSISAQATLKVMKEHNAIVGVAPSDVLSQLGEYIQKIDQPVAQVLIEALVVDYDLSKATELGVDVGARGASDTTLGFGMPYGLIPGIDVTFHGEQINNTLKRMGTVDLFGKEISVANLGVLPADFYISLKALEQRGIANVRSRPLLATINGHQASLSIGTTQYFILKTTIPYQSQNQLLIQESQSFQTIEADVRLDIVPFVGTDGLMIVEIKPDFKTPVGQLSSEVPPTINRRTLSSTVVLKEGETIMLGGLVQEIEAQTKSQVPILGSIPLLGALFSSSVTTERKVELIIYVTPHISYGEPFQNVYVPTLDD